MSGTQPGRETTPGRAVWHVISSSDLIALLRRAHAGEDPDALYLEEYVNADSEEVPGA